MVHETPRIVRQITSGKLPFVSKPFLAVLSLLTLSCAGPQVSQEDRRIASLIKNEKFDEAAANPDLLAPAFVEALREMKAEGADPKRIAAVANYFFDHYPFSIKDIEISERVFTAVAEAQFEASVQILPALPTCADLQRARTFLDKKRVLASWEGPHDDGGRCGRDLVNFLDQALRRGPEWVDDKALTGDGEPSVRELTRGLLDACGKPLRGQSQRVLMAFKIAALESLTGRASAEVWDCFGEERWNRLSRCRLAWVGALTWSPLYFPNYAMQARIGDQWCEEKEVRLRDLGRALVSWRTATSEFEFAGAPDSIAYGPVLAELDRLAKGTPFPDLVRYSLIENWLHLEQNQKVEEITREWWHDFDDPFLPTLLLLFVADRVREETTQWKADPAWSMRLAKEALDRDPEGELAPFARCMMAKLHAAAGREREKFDCLLAALKRPSLKSRYEHKFLADARSDAGYMLADHYETAGEWTRALEAWRSWEPYAYCGEGWGGVAEALHSGLGRCLDRTGKPAEAAPYLWKAVICSNRSDLETARRLKEIHESLGTTRDLAEKVRLAVEKDPENEDLKWLAEALGVPLK